MNTGGDGVVHTQVNVPVRVPAEIGVLQTDNIVCEEDLTAGRLRLVVVIVNHVLICMVTNFDVRIV